MKVDFGRTVTDYGRYRAGFPPLLFEQLAARGVGLAGQAILDLGTGTGALARDLARRGAEVTGLDPSAQMLNEARRLADAEGLPIEIRRGRAEATGLAAGAFQVVTAGQCWHWFDRAAAAVEARRVLRSGGRLAICYTDWLPLADNVVAATEALIETHNPAWTYGGGTGLHPAFVTDVALAGFAAIETFSHDHRVTYSHEAWRGRIRASAGVGASLPADAVERFDRELAALLAGRFPEDPLEVPHRVFVILAAAP